MLKILINLLQSIKQLGIENARNCTTISHFIWKYKKLNSKIFIPVLPKYWNKGVSDSYYVVINTTTS